MATHEPQPTSTPAESNNEQPESTGWQASESATVANEQNVPGPQRNNEVALNDGAITETLDTALHGKPGIAEGAEISGSNRADYYESQSYGKTDAAEELDALNDEQG